VLLISLHGSLDGDEVKARIVDVEPLDQAAKRVQMGLKIFVRDPKIFPQLAERLERQRREAKDLRGTGEVSLILMIENRNEVELRLPQKVPVTPQLAGAIKAMPGIVHVEQV